MDMLTPESGHSLAEQLGRHLQDLTTLKEADLCGAVSMQDRVFISTVHKAKGLEWDQVFLTSCNSYDFPDGNGAQYGNRRYKPRYVRDNLDLQAEKAACDPSQVDNFVLDNVKVNGNLVSATK